MRERTNDGNRSRIGFDSGTRQSARCAGRPTDRQPALSSARSASSALDVIQDSLRASVSLWPNLLCVLDSSQCLQQPSAPCDVKTKTRLDVALVERGLAPSRERARALILAGQVKVDGTVVSKAGTAVAPDAQVELAEPDHPYVGRGGVKLAHALDVFGIEVEGRRALDIGASTGGFTDVLLQRGAATRRSRSTSAAGSWIGGCAPIRASSCAKASTRARWRPTTCPTPSTSS